MSKKLLSGIPRIVHVNHVGWFRPRMLEHFFNSCEAYCWWYGLHFEHRLFKDGILHYIEISSAGFQCIASTTKTSGRRPDNWSVESPALVDLWRSIRNMNYFQVNTMSIIVQLKPTTLNAKLFLLWSELGLICDCVCVCRARQAFCGTRRWWLPTESCNADFSEVSVAVELRSFLWTLSSICSWAWDQPVYRVRIIAVFDFDC